MWALCGCILYLSFVFFSPFALFFFYLSSLYTVTFPISFFSFNRFLWVSLSHTCQTNATTTKYGRAFTNIDFYGASPTPNVSALFTQLISIVQNLSLRLSVHCDSESDQSKQTQWKNAYFLIMTSDGAKFIDAYQAYVHIPNECAAHLAEINRASGSCFWTSPIISPSAFDKSMAVFVCYNLHSTRYSRNRFFFVISVYYADEMSVKPVAYGKLNIENTIDSH